MRPVKRPGGAEKDRKRKLQKLKETAKICKKIMFFGSSELAAASSTTATAGASTSSSTTTAVPAPAPGGGEARMEVTEVS